MPEIPRTSIPEQRNEAKALISPISNHPPQLYLPNTQTYTHPTTYTQNRTIKNQRGCTGLSDGINNDSK